MIDYKTETQKKMVTWWKNPLGQLVLRQETSALQSLSRYFYGYYQIQSGVMQNVLPDVPRSVQKIMAQSADLEGCNEAMPFKCHCLDTLLLVHALEFSADPHQVLREAERVLVADGTLVLCCFNPWSLWGIRRLFSWQDNPPWHGHFFSQTRIRDWLALLNFEVIATEHVMFQPPLTSQKWLTRLMPMARWGRRLWPILSGVTILVTTKRTIPLTPIIKPWRAVRLFPPRQWVNNPARREKE